MGAANTLAYYGPKTFYSVGPTSAEKDNSDFYLFLSTIDIKHRDRAQDSDNIIPPWAHFIKLFETVIIFSPW